MDYEKNLPAKLREILNKEGFLPNDPKNPIKGSALAQLLAPLLNHEYTESSIQSTVSILAHDPTSPIARVEKRHGYYFRPLEQRISSSLPSIDPAVASSAFINGPGADINARAYQREEKFRSIFMRYMQREGYLPMHIEHTRGIKRDQGINIWKYPDVVLTKWDIPQQATTPVRLDSSMLVVKRSLGELPFSIASVELKVEVGSASVRQNFFQCLSNSKWAHHAIFAIASPIDDTVVLDEIRRLGNSYGVRVISFGLSPDILDVSPASTIIDKLSENEFDNIIEQCEIDHIVTAPERESLDWDHINDLLVQHTQFNELFSWIAYCLDNSEVYTYNNYRLIQKARGGSS